MTRLVNVSGASVLARGITKKRVNNEGKIIDNVVHSHFLFSSFLLRVSVTLTSITFLSVNFYQEDWN